MAPEFKNLTEEEKEEVKAKFHVEKDFMAAHDFYSDPANRQFRKLAVSAIACHCQGIDFDAFVPYLAMNIFDRFISKSKKPYTDVEEVHKVAMSCLLMAAIDRAYPDFFFPEPAPLDFVSGEIKDQIYEVLGFELAVTPFYFLNYFYPQFEEIGGLKRRCINEIIVQAQGEDDFNTHNYRPSEIAYSSLLAAADIAYPSIQIEREGVSDKARLAFCAQRLVDLCTEKNIMIERAPSSSATVKLSYHLGIFDDTDDESGQQRDSKGKGIAPEVEMIDDTDDEEDLVELYPSEAPMRQMKFYLQWPTKVAD